MMPLFVKRLRAFVKGLRVFPFSCQITIDCILKEKCGNILLLPSVASEGSPKRNVAGGLFNTHLKDKQEMFNGNS